MVDPLQNSVSEVRGVPPSEPLEDTVAEDRAAHVRNIARLRLLWENRRRLLRVAGTWSRMSSNSTISW